MVIRNEYTKALQRHYMYYCKLVEEYTDIINKLENKLLDDYSYNNIKLEGYKGRWSQITFTVRDDKIYYLFENDTWGDETCSVVTDSDLNPIGETYDNLENALDDILE